MIRPDVERVVAPFRLGARAVEEFLLRRKDFVLESAKKYFNDDIVSERGFVKTYPSVDCMSGSFAARLKKTKNP